MSCKLCAWLCNWFCADSGLDEASFWANSDKWERAQSNDWELWAGETDHQRELNRQASELGKTDPEAAFRRRVEAADAGSTWAMQKVGWGYATGTDVAANFELAQSYYRRAITAGSSMATILYAQLLAKHERYDESQQVLEEGVRADFIPAIFWRARIRYRQSPTRSTAREIAPLLEYATGKGHLGAELTLNRLLLRGKLGLRGIARGFGMMRAYIVRQLKNDKTGEEATDLS